MIRVDYNVVCAITRNKREELKGFQHKMGKNKGKEMYAV